MLFQQYVVTAYCSVEQYRLDYIRKHQDDIRNDYLAGLYDAIARGDRSGSEVGMRTILPASFVGGPRYMYSHYLDALAICRVHGNPSFFITFTCNVKWPEILDFMQDFPAVTVADMPDVVDRVFEQKIHQLVAYLRDFRPFGPFCTPSSFRSVVCPIVICCCGLRSTQECVQMQTLIAMSLRSCQIGILIRKGIVWLLN